MELFENRRLIIATKHRKESVIAGLLEQELGVRCFVDESFDTDVLGTFDGEVERELDPVSTVREKCLRAMKQNHCDLGVASEGSFGPHPSMFFINGDDEFLIFIDTLHNMEIIVREISTKTNFNGKQVQNRSDLLEFAQQAGFPSHGLILRPAKDSYTDMRKGIANQQELLDTYELLQSKYDSVYVETDMRAMHNPTRMAVIGQAAQKLLVKIKSACPQCHMPGFAVTDAKKGLKCNLCGSPTNSTLCFVYLCQHCGHCNEELYPHGKTSEEPTYCDFCNP